MVTIISQQTKTGILTGTNFELQCPLGGKDILNFDFCKFIFTVNVYENGFFSIFCVKCISYGESIGTNKIFCAILDKKSKILLFLSKNN